MPYFDSIPGHWTLSQFSRHIAINAGQVDPRIEPFSGMALIAPNHIESRTGKLLELQTAEVQGADSGKYLVKAGQIIYSKIRPNLVKAVVAPVDCLCSADMYGLTPDPALLDSRFMMYVLLSQPFTDYVVDSSMRVAMPKVNHESLGLAPIWFPSMPEQRGIVDFLDRETAKIDALITKQEQLIATLCEDRASTITHLVTSGLDSSVETKDSGIDWLGRIPRHWAVVQSRRYFTQRKARALPGDDQLTASQKYGVIPQRDFMEREGAQVTQVLLNAEILKHVEAGDFVISMRSFQGGIEYSEYAGCVSSAYVPLVPSGDIVPSYFRYVLKSSGYIKALQSTSNLVRDGQALRFENFAMVPLPLMPRAEQHSIADYLDIRTAKIDALIKKTDQMIETLREYRSTLITDAVTGKIDVRGVA